MSCFHTPMKYNCCWISQTIRSRGKFFFVWIVTTRNFTGLAVFLVFSPKFWTSSLIQIIQTNTKSILSSSFGQLTYYKSLWITCINLRSRLIRSAKLQHYRISSKWPRAYDLRNVKHVTCPDSEKVSWTIPG